MQDELASTEVTQYYYTSRRDLGNVVNRDSKQGQKGDRVVPAYLFVSSCNKFSRLFIFVSCSDF